MDMSENRGYPYDTHYGYAISIAVFSEKNDDNPPEDGVAYPAW
jgi:hypothetical protein